MTLRFTPGNHQYRLDGRPIPGVTGLIKGGLPSPQLMYWSAKTVAEYVADHEDDVERLRAMGRGPMVAALKETPWQSRDEASAKGTDVHAIAVRLVAGEQVDVPEHLAGYVEACVRFLDEWEPEELLVETPVAHREHWWAGTLDLVARMRNGSVALLDWKTGKGIYPEVAFQLAAYRHAQFYAPTPEVEEPMPAIDWCAAVHLRSDGWYEVIPVDAGLSTYRAFRHMAFIAKTAKTAKDLVHEPITPEQIPAGAAVVPA